MSGEFSVRNICRATRLPVVPMLSFVVAVVLAAGPLYAANDYFNLVAGQSADWSTSGSWSSLAPPQPADTAYIIYGGTATITQPGAVCTYLYLGDPNSVNTGTIQMSGGNLSVASKEFIGNQGAGTFTQTGGTNGLGSSAYLYLGDGVGGGGTYNLSGSGVISASDEWVGYFGLGHVQPVGRYEQPRLVWLAFPRRRRGQGQLQPQPVGSTLGKRGIRG